MGHKTWLRPVLGLPWQKFSDIYTFWTPRIAQIPWFVPPRNPDFTASGSYTCCSCPEAAAVQEELAKQCAEASCQTNGAGGGWFPCLSSSTAMLKQVKLQGFPPPPNCIVKGAMSLKRRNPGNETHVWVCAAGCESKGREPTPSRSLLQIPSSYLVFFFWGGEWGGGGNHGMYLPWKNSGSFQNVEVYGGKQKNGKYGTRKELLFEKWVPFRKYFSIHGKSGGGGGVIMSTRCVR